MHNEFSRAYITDINSENALLHFVVFSGIRRGICVVPKELKNWIYKTKASSKSLSGKIGIGGWLDEKEVGFGFTMQHLGGIEASVEFVFEKEKHSYKFEFDQSYLAPAIVAAERFLNDRSESM